MSTKTRKILIVIGLGALLSLGSAGAVAGSGGHAEAGPSTSWYHM